MSKRQTCAECDERYAMDLAEARERVGRRKSLEVSRVMARGRKQRTAG